MNDEPASRASFIFYLKSFHMAWICPTCKRPFKNRNQVHSCVQISPDTVLSVAGKNVQGIYNKLMAAVKKFGPYDITATPKAIFLKNPGSFVAIKPKKATLELEFLLDTAIDEFPVYKNLRTSKNRVAHFIRLDDPSQVDMQLIQWLKLSYTLISNA